MPIWGQTPDHSPKWVVVDLETSGFQPGRARVISVAALAIDADGTITDSVVSLLNPGVDPGPTHVHGLTPEMLEGQPEFANVVPDLIALLRGRTLVAHNVGFDYSFLAAEAELVGAELPTEAVMCTVELTRRLALGTPNLRLETLAAHWGVEQLKAHDAYDDARVLAEVLPRVLERARERGTWLPIREATRKRWPNGRVTHDELRSLKTLASRQPCHWLNPGPHTAGQPLVQGMRVALSAEVARTHEELIEQIMQAGLSYSDAVDEDTSVVICNQPNPEQGKGFHARSLGVPLLDDETFMTLVGRVAGGTDIEQFTVPSRAGAQYSLF
ncbi:DEDDh family exonuclease [Mycobacterium sp. CBMA271]|uniref:DEDDh family exonuclease n=1 Tax=unclassified Mycobacteroides TaxID=2618759 RepID=UPI0012DEAF65|nr:MULTISPECIES: DEDDh family exonuclease [unclassified Mycobacteroides]MUM20066.1 DNA polymerase III subunit epsilon [Mycobacteroides sp. CBMA 326]MUM24333.1 DEDDh family exonuclease [Mycobacteroides sp. CBMA 271]